MIRALIVLALVAACDASQVPTRDSLVAKLGDHDVVITVNFAKLDIAAFVHLIPDQVACVRSVMERDGVLVIGLSSRGSEAYWTKLSEAKTRACFDKIAAHYGLEPRGEHVVAWKAGLLTVQEAGHPPTGKLSAELRAQLAKAPRGAAVVVAIGASETYRITGATLWLEDAGDSLRVVALADGKDPEAAKSYLGSNTTQLLARAGNLFHLHLDESSFKLTSPSPLAARIEGTVPKNELVGTTPAMPEP